MADMIEPLELDEDEKQRIARRLVDQAREQGVDLVGSGGVLTGLTKTTSETALDEGSPGIWASTSTTRSAGTAVTLGTGQGPRRC